MKTLDESLNQSLHYADSEIIPCCDVCKSTIVICYIHGSGHPLNSVKIKFLKDGKN
jgi:hypothetical protein